AAVEGRLYAEDALAGFVPSTGRLEAVRRPDGPGVRLDAGYQGGDRVVVHYDSLLAKLCCWGADRPQALARMRRALAECAYLGVRTTVAFHRYVMEHPEFVAATHDTGFVARHWPPAGETVPAEAAQRLAVGAALAHYHAPRGPGPDDASPPDRARAPRPAPRGR